MEMTASVTTADAASEFKPEQFQELDRWIDAYRGKSGAIIRALNKAQEIFGYLPRDIQNHVAKGLDKPLSEVFGITTFYSFFSLVPRGKHTVCVCMGTACYVRGGKNVIEQCSKMMGVDVGETTEDREFSLQSVRCMGACALAPAVRVDEDVYRQMSPKKIRGILARYSEKYGGGN